MKTKKNYFLLGSIVCFGLFFLLSLIVFYRASFLSINDEVYLFINKIKNPYTYYISNFLSLFGDKYIIIPTIGIVSLILYLKQHKRLALHLLGVMLIALLFSSILKNTIVYLRPNQLLNDLKSYAFPSRHATLCSTYVIFLLALIAPKIKYFSLSLGLAFLFILLVIASRLFLEVHWLVDVIGGVLLGSACGLLGAYSFYRKPGPIYNARLLLMNLLFAFMMVSACYLTLNLCIYINK